MYCKLNLTLIQSALKCVYESVLSSSGGLFHWYCIICMCSF